MSNLVRIAVLTALLLAGVEAAPSTDHGATVIRISNTDIHPTRISQGDRFTVDVTLESTKKASTLTAAFRVVNEADDVVARLESDFFELAEPGEHRLRFTFRWSDLDAKRSGTLRIASAIIKQYTLEERSSEILAQRGTTHSLRVEPITHKVHRLFVSRELSLWWLTRMGRVDTPLSRRQGLSNCVMFGGGPASWTRNDFVAAPGTDALCYWEITGYAVRALALEYERTGEDRYLSWAKSIARAIVTNLRDATPVGLSGRYLPAFNHYDGRIGNFYKGKAVLFDHGQLLMGLLELVRVMDNAGIPADAQRSVRDAARAIGEFMLAARKANGGRIPFSWSYSDAQISEDIEQTSKVVIGFNDLASLAGRPEFSAAAEGHLEQMLRSEPYRGSDHHGRSYMAYGFLRAFQDYGDDPYLQAAIDWTASVAQDLSNTGRLVPIDEYSVIPAQSQLIRNATLLWKLTGDQRFLHWAGHSAEYLGQSANPWTYRQPVLRLGRFYRQSGGQYNNLGGDELCSWASIFHIDAMYHYLGSVYGHVFVGEHEVLSMRGPVTVQRGSQITTLRLEADKEENIGIYIADGESVARVEVNGDRFDFHSSHTVRIPISEGMQEVEVHFQKHDKTEPHLVRTSSRVLEAKAVGTESLQIELQGKAGTAASAQILWPGGTPNIRIGGKRLPASEWSWSPDTDSLMLHYTHTGRAQTAEVTTLKASD